MGKESTEQLILQAARSEFMAKGFDGTRMRSIAERAEINKGLLHYYFKTKEALLVNVFKETFGELFRATEAALIDRLDVFDQIEAFVHVHMDFHCKHPDLIRFVVTEMNRDPQVHADRMKQAGIQQPNKGLLDAMEAAKKNGQIRQDVDASNTMLSIMSMILFPVMAKPMVKYMHGINETEYKTLIKERRDQITAFIVHAIKAD